MFTTGSKLLIGSAVLATVAAIVYGITQDPLGTIGLASAAAALCFLAGVNIWAADSNVAADDLTAVATCEAAEPAPGNSVWPMAFGVGAATVLLGLVTQQSIFTIGLVVLVAAGAQWMVQAWAESASTDAAVNQEVRSRLANPLEFPLLGAIAVGAIAFSFSRVMLWLSKTNTVIAFIVLAAVVAAVAFFFAYRPSVKRGAIGGALAAGAIVIVAGGVAAGVDGERDIHPHETTSDLAAEEHCGSPEEFDEVDHDVSQTLSLKANAAAQITLTSADELDLDLVGPLYQPYSDPNTGEEFGDGLVIARSNTTNIIFRNDSDEDRRLTVDLGETVITTEEGEEETIRNQQCTTLIAKGAAQLMTLTVGAPSIAFADDPDAYRFFVPGTDAELGLFVP